MPPRSSGEACSSSSRAGGLRRRPRRLIGLTARLELWQFAGIAGVVFVGLLALWWLATSGGWVGPLFLPSPVAVWRRLAELAANVFSIERISTLAVRARQLLDRLGYYNVATRVGDGTLGWSDEAPFDAIVVTAGSPQVPRPLIAQLAEGGRLVFPIGEEELQTLVRIRKEGERLREEYFGECRFVKLVGRYGWER